MPQNGTSRGSNMNKKTKHFAEHAAELYFVFASILAGLPDELEDAKRDFSRKEPNFRKMRDYLDGNTTAFGGPLNDTEFDEKMFDLLYTRRSIFRVAQKFKSLFFSMNFHVMAKNENDLDEIIDYVMHSFKEIASKPRYSTGQNAPRSIFSNNPLVVPDYFENHKNSNLERDIQRLTEKKDDYYNNRALISNFIRYAYNVWLEQRKPSDIAKRLKEQNNKRNNARIALLSDSVRKSPDEQLERYRSGGYYADPNQIAFDELQDYLNFASYDIEFAPDMIIKDMNAAGMIPKICSINFFSIDNWEFITKYDDIFTKAIIYEKEKNIKTTWTKSYRISESEPFYGDIELLGMMAELKDPRAFKKPNPSFYLEMLPTKAH